MSTPYTTSPGRGRVSPPPRRRLRALSTLILTTLTPTISAAASTLPYIPTTILIPPPSLDQSILATRAYIFTSNPSTGAIDLLTLDLSRQIQANSQPELIPLTSTSPTFLTSGSFSPSILPNGTIVVITSDNNTPCSSASTNGATLHTYSSSISSSASSPSHSGIWSSTPITPRASWSESLNPYHLSATLQFIAQLSPTLSPPIFYLYGGMCPFSNSTSSTWQSSASYSNRMLRIDSETMSISQASNAGGPPVAEAGFTFTPLSPPSIANRSGIVTQQMSYVMIGGHTKDAFVNISTAAVWSLPEESWGFVSIEDAEGGRADLAVKDVAAPMKVDSRSGHSAVLNEDGSRLVIFGGWVGDLKTPAEPQLVVVEIGVGVEGWTWRVPSVDGDGKGEGEGVYGHGAVLLPGDVMMVYGGWEIGGTGTKKKRDEGRGVRFFNITEMNWQEEYSHPDLGGGGGNGGKDGTGNGGKNGEGKEETTPEGNGKNLGLGLGLGIGVPILIAIIILMISLRRRQLRRRAERDEALRGLAQGIPAGGGHHSDEMADRNDPNSGIGFFPWNASTAQEWYTGGHDPYDNTATGRRRSLGYETLRGGGSRSAYIPPMPAAARPRGGVARGLYQPTTGVDTGNNRIHPIYEDDEGEDDDLGLEKHPLSPDLDERDDPFLTPTTDREGGGGGGLFPTAAGGNGSSSGSGSRGSPSPEMVQVSSVLLPGEREKGRQKQDPEVQGWVSDVDAADAVLTARISRHGSTTTTPPALKLAGNGPSTPTRPGRLSPTRRTSTRSGKELLDDTGRTESNLSDRSAFSFVQGAERAHMRSSYGVGRSNSSSGSSAHTYSTAKSNFATMQAEGPGLLLGRYHEGGQQEEEEDEYSVPGSPSKSKPRRSWFGSLRRVFSGATPSDGSSSRGDSPTRDSLLDGDSSSRLVRLGPAGVLLRRKQGREAWDSAEHEQEDEWDVEKAVEQRMVQIMFTVPKERLRVVNAEVEREEMAAVVVDPGRESYVDSEGEDGEEGGKGKGKEVDRVGSVPVPVPVPMPMGGSGTSKQHEEEEMDAGREQKQSIDEKDLLAVHDHYLSQNQGQQEGTLAGISPSTSMRSAATSHGAIHTAEAIRLERPRTRVLEMVESFEAKSRDGSPSGSPSR